MDNIFWKNYIDIDDNINRNYLTQRIVDNMDVKIKPTDDKAKEDMAYFIFETIDDFWKELERQK